MDYNYGMGGFVIWITGLPGSGKSAVSEGLKAEIPGLVILRMDELRKVATPEPTYSGEERDVLYRALVFMAGRLASLGHGVIIDATGNLRKWRDLARELIPRYAEVYLACPMEVCMERERERKAAFSAPKDIYEKGRRGWPVPGLTAPYEEPTNPELRLDTAACSINECVGKVKAMVEGMKTLASKTER